MKPTLPPSFLAWLSARDVPESHRQLLIVSGTRDWTEKVSVWLTSHYADRSILAIDAPFLPSPAVSIPGNAFHRKLGQEVDIVIYNGFEGARASALMATSGLVKSAGLMILLCPVLKDWPALPDPQLEQRTSYGFKPGKEGSYWIKWLIRHIQTDSAVCLLTETQFSGTVELASTESVSPKGTCNTDDQQRAVAALIKLAHGRAKKPLVITADRGRGKSSAMGIAAGQLITGHGMDIIVTSPGIETVQQVFKHATRLAQDLTHQGKLLLVHPEGGSLTFVPVDQLLINAPSADLVMVDEAAAIPTPSLVRLLALYPRIAFSTTIHGYEGSGRGFEIRFKQHLAQATPGWRSVHLQAPIRWHDHDPLENFWFNTMLAHEVPLVGVDHDAEIAVRQVLQQELLGDPSLALKIFCLLLNAHYRTSPDDLVRLLEAPDCMIFVVTQGDNIISVAQLAIEGGAKLKELRKQISVGKRRVPGHLTAQSLAYGTADPLYTDFSYWRIVRIATQATHRQKGYAGRLLGYIERIAKDNNIMGLSTSFGAEEGLIKFWRQLQFEILKLGLKTDAKSGENSILMVKPLATELTVSLSAVRQLLLESLMLQRRHYLARLDSGVLVEAISSLTSRVHLSAYDKQRIDAFVFNNLTLDLCGSSLTKLLFSAGTALLSLTPQQRRLMIDLLCKQTELDDLYRSHNLTGKKQLVSAVTEATRCLMATMAQEQKFE